MGKTKTKMIDDSLPQEEVKKEKPKREKVLGINRAEGKKILGTNVKRDEALKKAESQAGGDAERARSRASTASEQSERGRTRKTEAAEPQAKQTTKQSKASTKKGSLKYRSNKYKEASEKVERNKFYPINEATELIKQVSYSKFDGTLEIHINTTIKGVRGLVTLPFASGKKLKIMAYGKGAQDSGADLVGDDASLAEIAKGKINFDVLVTTAEWMPKLARAAKILGPRGLMPNPKNGTISSDLKKTVSELQGGKTEYKTEAKANVIHLGIGKVTQPAEELSQNIKILLSTIGKTRIKKAVLSPTMGPGVKLNLNTL